MAFFSSSAGLSPRQDLLRKYETGRMNLMLAIILTAINIVAPLFGANFYFMFALHIPTMLMSGGMLLCGRYPAEVYRELGLDSIVFLDDGYFYMFVGIAVVITLLFALCWFMSRGGRYGWLIAACVLFAIDTVTIFLSGAILESLLDIFFHAWVLYHLVVAVISYIKLKNMPDGDEVRYSSILDAFSNPDPNNMS